MIPREDVALAVFNLTAPLSASLSPPGPFVTRSRRIVPAPQMQAQQMPALYQLQDIETVEPSMRTLEGKYDSIFRFVWVVYVSATVDSSVAPATSLNAAVDALLAVLPPANVPLDIDGVKCPFGWDGSINYIEGIIQGVSMAEIPVMVKVPTADLA